MKCTTKTAYNHTQNLALGLGTIDSLQQNMVSVVRMLEKGSKNKGKSAQSLLQKAASSARLKQALGYQNSQTQARKIWENKKVNDKVRR